MTRRQTRIVIITAVVLGLFCLGMVFWALTRPPEPIAEPAPFPTSTTATTTADGSSTTSAAPTTTTTPPPATTTKAPAKAPVAPPKTTAQPPATAAPPATTLNPLCQAGEWQRDTQYNAGTLIRHNGAEWYARSSNYNAEPGANAQNAWIRAITC